MTRRTLDILSQCQRMLEKYRQLLDESLRKGDRQDDPQAVMLLRTFDFGIRTAKAVEVLLESDGQNGMFVCTLCRAFFEAAVRVLWASRTLPNADNPWVLLQKHWATEDLKWADDAKEFPELAEHAECIRKCRQEVLDRADGKRVTLSIMKMLRDIQQADIAEELREAGRKDAEFAYANVYRLLCQPAHGHLVAIGNTKSGAFLIHARIGFAMATSWLLQACCHVGVADPKAEIEAITKLIIDILKKEQNG